MKQIKTNNEDDAYKRLHRGANDPQASPEHIAFRRRIKELWVEGKRSKSARGLVPVRPLPKSKPRIMLCVDWIEEGESTCIFMPCLSDAEAAPHIEQYQALYPNEEEENDEEAALGLKINFDDKSAGSTVMRPDSTKNKAVAHIQRTARKGKKKKSQLFDISNGLLGS